MIRNTALQIAMNYETFYQDNDDLIKLNDLMINALPSNMWGANVKPKDIENKYHSFFKPTEEALHNKFIRYGTKNTVNVLMFDDDTASTSDLSTYREYLLSTILIEPTYIIETDKGFQFGFILDTPIYKNANNDLYEIAKGIKAVATNAIDGDVAGSHRLIGIWRNPLVHPHTFNDKTFSIYELAKHFEVMKAVKVSRPTIKTNTYKKSNLKMKSNDAIELGFTNGNRNNFLFNMGIKILFNNRTLSDDALLNELNQINSSHSNSVDGSEVNIISNSVMKYLPTFYDVPGHTKETKRGIYSNYMWENNIHGQSNRFSFGGIITSHNKRVNAYEDILQSRLVLMQQGKATPTKKEVISVSKFKKSRVYDLLNELDEMQLSVNVFLEMISIKESKEMLLEQSGKAILDNLQDRYKEAIKVLQEMSSHLLDTKEHEEYSIYDSQQLKVKYKAA